ncbi:MAG: acyl--CoA ligase [Acetatifactor sp.]|nr:acyl--CoA ligase [Acetatifactor sp.]
MQPNEKKNESKLTGYPSIDKPWFQYYSSKEISAQIPESSMYDYMSACNFDRLDAFALNYFGKRITHKQLHEKIDICAKALIELGAAKGDIISICMLTIPEAVYCLYAANKIGATCNFIVLNATETTIHEQIADTKSKIVITVDMVLDKIISASMDTDIKQIISVSLQESMPFILKALLKLRHKGTNTDNEKVMLWKEFLLKGNKDIVINRVSQSDIPAVIEYTSGTSGVAKGVLLSNQAGNALASNYINTGNLLNFEKGETFLDILPPFYAYGVYVGIHMPLCVGVELILVPDPSPQKFAKWIKKYKPNHFTGGASHIDYMTRNSKIKKMNLSFLKTIAYGGDTVNKDWETQINNFLFSRGAKYKLLNGYGMTETAGSFCTQTHKTDFMVPFAKNNIKIIDIDTKKELMYGQEGEICLSGPSLMLEYYQNPIETAETVWIEDDGVRWLHTGDLGYVTEEGHFIISGRIKRIYWTIGNDGIIYRVYPMQIEEVICTHDNVNKCVVVGKEQESGGYLSVAYIILNDETLLGQTINDLKSVCCEKLPESSWPAIYRSVSEFPMTSFGKVDYRKLEEIEKNVETNKGI